MKTDNDTIQLGKRANQVYEKLLQDIRGGVYRPDSRLPIESELCEIFDVSRSPLRAAMKRLSQEGFVIPRQGSGVYVADKIAKEQKAPVISIMYGGDMATLTRIQDHVLKQGHMLSFYSQLRNQWNPQQEEAFINCVLNQRHLALLANCHPRESAENTLLQQLCEAGTRVIHIEPSCTEEPREEYIMPDYRRTGYMAAVSLISAGYKRLFVMTHSAPAPYSELLIKGFREAANSHRNELSGNQEEGNDVLYLKEGGILQQESESCLHSALRTEKVGILATTCGRSVNAVDLITGMGYTVPEDASVVGVQIGREQTGGHPVGLYSFDRYEICEKAINSCINAGREELREYVLPRFIPAGTAKERTMA